MLERMGLDDSHVKFVVKKIIGIAIRSTYYIFCCRNKEWTHPELMAGVGQKILQQIGLVIKRYVLPIAMVLGHVKTKNALT